MRYQLSFTQLNDMPIGDLIKKERKKTQEAIDRSKSIIMMNYYDQKKRSTLEKKIDKKINAAAKVQ